MGCIPKYLDIRKFRPYTWADDILLLQGRRYLYDSGMSCKSALRGFRSPSLLSGKQANL
jgi:hypothetical protein